MPGLQALPVFRVIDRRLLANPEAKPAERPVVTRRRRRRD